MADGKGVEQESAKALSLFEKSANLGDPYAMVDLALAYYYANGGFKKDMKKVFRVGNESSRIRLILLLYVILALIILGWTWSRQRPSKSHRIFQKGSRDRK